MTVTRFAPSPTGSLHVGGARTALFCLLHARKEGGVFLLRIEDTDQARSTEESTRGILRDLRWLGLEWDEGPEKDRGHGPYFQSQRLHLYEAAFDKLIQSGHVYEAWDTREELIAMREQAQRDKVDFVYKRRPVTPEQVAAYKAEGRVPVLRLVAPDHDVRVMDEVLGPVLVTADQLEDIVVRKADGFPTYHFAVVIDDAHMEVTQILRGSEHLRNTHKHIGLMEALGYEPPKFGHLPLIFSMSGSKMSKRDKAKAARAGARQAHKERGAKDYGWLAEQTGIDAYHLQRFMKKKTDDVPTAQAIAEVLGLDLPMIEVMDFRKGGFVPEAVVNFLALLGWNPGPEADGTEREIFTVDELVERWDLSRVGKTSAKFDVDKLRWMNGEYLKSLPDAVLEQHLQSWAEVVHSELMGQDKARRDAIVALYKPRAATFVELEEAARWFWTRPADYDAKAVKKWIRKGGGLERLARVRGVLETVAWTEPALEEGLKAFAAEEDVGLGKVAQPLRVALSGAAATPGLFECLVLFERDEVLARIDAAVEALTEA